VPTYEPSPLLSWDTATKTLDLLAPVPGYGTNPPTGYFDSSGDALSRWSWTKAGWKWDGTITSPPLFNPPAGFVAEPGSSEMLFYSYQPYSGSCPIPPSAQGKPQPSPCGEDPTGLLYSQTWTWNGATFTKNTPTQAPPSSQDVIADARTGHVIALAGSDVWQWNQNTWTKLNTTIPIPSAIAAAYDPQLGDVILLGESSGANPHVVTWAWDGTDWSPVTTSTASTTSACWPSGTAPDGSAQTTAITVADVQVEPASPTPPTAVRVTSARDAAVRNQPGATAVRTVLATIRRPNTSVSQRAWVVIECNTPYTSKGPPGAGSGLATVLTAVDPTSGQVIFSATEASCQNGTVPVADRCPAS
jgi:hypothetical protein